jgi:protein SSD1
VADIAHFVKANSLVDREAKKRGTGVYLMNRVVNMLPPRLSNEICSLLPGEERLTISVVFQLDPTTGAVDENVWIGKGVIKSSGKLSYEDVDAVINGKAEVSLAGATADDIRLLGVSKYDHHHMHCGSDQSIIDDHYQVQGSQVWQPCHEYSISPLVVSTR